MLRRALSPSLHIVALATALLACACEVPPEVDAGPAEPTCEGGGERTVAMGAHGEAWDPLEDGDVVPSFDRPQGGVGTHLTARFTGFPLRGHSFDRLRVEMTREEDGFAVSRYATVAFGVSCEEDGSLLLVDIPVRYEREVEAAADIDGAEVVLTTVLELDDDEEISSSVRVVLQESEFIPPAWWSTTGTGER